MEIVLRSASKLRQPLENESVTVLAAVDVSVANDIGVIVRNNEVSVSFVVLVDILVDRVVVRTENHRLISHFSSPSSISNVPARYFGTLI